MSRRCLLLGFFGSKFLLKYYPTRESLLIPKSAKLYEIGAGTSEVRRMVLGRAFNKEYSSYAS